MSYRDTSADVTLNNANEGIMSTEFEKWWKESGIEFASIFETGAAKKGWNARQPEIDALKHRFDEAHLGDKDIKILSDYMARVTPPAQNYVKMPTTAEEAELMAKLGMMWLEQNAPDRLKTPPAQEQGERNWFEGTEDCDGNPLPTDDEIVAFIGEEFGSDRVAIETFRQIQDYLIKRRLQIPPAQEDEAVGYVSAGAMKSLGDKESDGQTIFPRKGMIYNIPLYTRPSSELRKAAEELFDGQFLDGCVITQSLAHKLGKLRAALDKK